MKAKPTSFPEVYLLKPKVIQDKRGSFSENFVSKDFEKITGKKIIFCQDNLTRSRKGVIRGLHYQLPPFSQSKLVSVILGTVLDIVVDIRKGSPTFGQHFSQELSAENQLQLFIPRGFAHGFITLSETSIFHYKVDNYYDFKSERSIAPNDPDLGIDWRLPNSQWIQSKKDQNYLFLQDANIFDFKDNFYA